jgi:hypothetical protein
MLHIHIHNILLDVIVVELDKNKMGLLFIDNKVPQSIINNGPLQISSYYSQSHVLRILSSPGTAGNSQAATKCMPLDAPI